MGEWYFHVCRRCQAICPGWLRDDTIYSLSLMRGIFYRAWTGQYQKSAPGVDVIPPQPATVLSVPSHSIIWTHWNWSIFPVLQILNGLRLRQSRPDNIRRCAGICCCHRVNVIQHSVKPGCFCLRQFASGLQFQLNQTNGSHSSINQ